MSAFVVDNSTIHKIIAYLKRHPDVMPYDAGMREEKSSVEWAALGAKLRQLNVGAVMARYPGSAVNDLPGKIGETEYEHRTAMPPTSVQAYKSLSCYLYQCTEGNIDETDLYKMMEDTKHGIASKIIRALPEHDRAEWG